MGHTRQTVYPISFFFIAIDKKMSANMQSEPTNKKEEERILTFTQNENKIFIKYK